MIIANKSNHKRAVIALSAEELRSMIGAGPRSTTVHVWIMAEATAHERCGNRPGAGGEAGIATEHGNARTEFGTA